MIGVDVDCEYWKPVAGEFLFALRYRRLLLHACFRGLDWRDRGDARGSNLIQGPKTGPSSILSLAF